MSRVFRTILPCLVPILSLIYAVGDHTHWWDDIFGRITATRALSRLSSPKGCPEIIIFSDEPEFTDLLHLLISRTKNETVVQRSRKSIFPSAIVRVGGTIRPDVGDDLPEGWPNPKFVPESLPVAVVYDYPRSGGSISKEEIEPVGNLEDVRQWIDDSRNTERFFVSTVLIGILGIIVAVLEITRSRNTQTPQ